MPPLDCLPVIACDKCRWLKDVRAENKAWNDANREAIEPRMIDVKAANAERRKAFAEVLRVLSRFNVRSSRGRRRFEQWLSKQAGRSAC